MSVSNVRLSNLVQRAEKTRLSLLSVRLPVMVLDRVDALTRRINGRKSEVIVALLNEGLDRFDQGRPRRGRPKRAKE